MVEAKRSLKYLGVYLDDRLQFSSHVEMAISEGGRNVARLVRAFPNIHGPGDAIRRLLASAPLSAFYYAAPAWGVAFKKARNVSRATAFVRRLAMRVASAYRTLSGDAAFVLARIRPPDIEVALREELHQGRARPAPALREGLRERGPPLRTPQNEPERRAMRAWQERWDGTVNGAWTRRFIPNITKWVERGHGRLHFHLTQALTGHGCFRSYLKRIGRLDDDRCPACRQQETVEHVIVHCPRMGDLRRELMREVPGPITPERLGELMLSSQQGWTTADQYLTAVVKRLEEEERARNRAHV